MTDLARSRVVPAASSRVADCFARGGRYCGALFCPRSLGAHCPRSAPEFRARTTRSNFASLVRPASIGRGRCCDCRLCRYFRLGRIDDFSGQSAGDRLAALSIHIARQDTKFTRSYRGTGTLERASEVLKELGKELDKPQRSTLPAVTVGPDGASPNKPIPVEVKQPDPGALQTLRRSDHPFDSPPDDDRDCDHLRHFHSDAKSGLEKQNDPSRRRAGSSTHDGSA